MQEQTEIKTPKYEYVDSPVNPEVGAIKILEGEYEGLVYQYGKAAFNERDDGQCELKFQFTAFDKPEHIDIKSNELYTVLGSILVEVLDEHLEETKEFENTHVDLDQLSDEESLKEVIEEAKSEIEKNRNENS
tara:strand:- start:599 stop:997 length:399 start_codon:yes stop_codon:yes gene_type:complete